MFAQALIEAPTFFSPAHEHFLAAGADGITTNTYALVPFHIGTKRFNASGHLLIKQAANLARDSATRYPGAMVSYRPDCLSSRLNHSMSVFYPAWYRISPGPDSAKQPFMLPWHH